MKNHRILAGAALAADLTPATHAQTQPGITSGPDTYHRQFLYFLPKAAVAATVTQQITVCPVGTGRIEVELDANGAPTALGIFGDTRYFRGIFGDTIPITRHARRRMARSPLVSAT